MRPKLLAVEVSGYHLVPVIVAVVGRQGQAHLLLAKRTRPTVVAVRVSGGDLVLLMCGPG